MMRQTLFVFACLCALMLSGVALTSFNTGNDAAEFGKCGYYADSFQGRPTSSGEKYNKNALTCAHKTLPFGTKVRITRIDNKRSVVVRVNDRGPFIEGYVADVSRAAAEALDLIKAGTTRVKVEVVESAKSASATDNEMLADVRSGRTQLLVAQDDESPATYSQEEPRAKKTAAKGGEEPSSNLYKVDIKQSEKRGFGIQVTSLSDANNVLPIINKLQAQWPSKVLVNVVKNEFGEATYKVFVGPFADKKTAEAQQKKVAKSYKKTMIIDLEEI